MFCEKCGAQNADGSQFCRVCGAGFAQSSVPPRGNPLVKRNRDITASSRTFMLINAICGILVVLIPLLPLTERTGRNVFAERATLISIAYNLGSRGFTASGILLLFVYISSVLAIIAGVVLAFLRFKGSAFCILSGSLYPLIYSFCLVRTMLGIKDCPDRANPICYFYFIACILAIISSALSLSKYKLND